MAAVFLVCWGLKNVLEAAALRPTGWAHGPGTPQLPRCSPQGLGSWAVSALPALRRLTSQRILACSGSKRPTCTRLRSRYYRTVFLLLKQSQGTPTETGCPGGLPSRRKLGCNFSITTDVDLKHVLISHINKKRPGASHSCPWRL